MPAPKSLVFQGQRYTREDLVRTAFGQITWKQFLASLTPNGPNFAHNHFSRAMGLKHNAVGMMDRASDDWERWTAAQPLIRSWLRLQLQALKVDPHDEVHEDTLRALARLGEQQAPKLNGTPLPLSKALIRWAKAFRGM